MEVVRKHTAGVNHALLDIRRALEMLVAKRDERRDGFVKVIRTAMRESLGDEALKYLTSNGIPKNLVKQALELARQQGAFTIFSLVDAVTRLAQKLVNAGDRLELDAKAASLLTLAL